jgi:hypothetical protein
MPLSKNHQVQAQVIHGEITSVTRANYQHSRASTVDIEPPPTQPPYWPCLDSSMPHQRPSWLFSSHLSKRTTPDHFQSRFGFILNKQGSYVPELEKDTVTARDLFENGLFSGRLRQKYTEMGLLYVEVDSVLLPELERHERKKQGPRRKKRTHDEPEVIVLSSDDDEQGCPVRGSDQAHQKLPSAKASAVSYFISPSPEVRTLTVPRASKFDVIPSRRVPTLRQSISIPRRSGLSLCLMVLQPLQEARLPNRFVP